VLNGLPEDDYIGFEFKLSKNVHVHGQYFWKALII